MSLYLHGIGHFHPPTIIDNAFLEALDIGTSNEWILERVGIRERRTVLPLDYIRETRNADTRAADEAALCSSLDLAEHAAELALKRAGISARDIGLVVAGGCCPGANLPADAARLAARLQMVVPSFDLNAGCSSFGAQLHVLGAMHAALPEFVLVVNAEATTRVVDYAERSAAVLWGDCATAAVVSPRVAAPLRLAGSGIDGDPRGAAAVSIPRFGHFKQQGSAVQRFAIKTMLSCLRRSLERFSALPQGDAGRTRFIGHQANRLALEHVRKSARLDDSDHWQNVASFGNTGASGGPSVLSQHWSELAGGDRLAMALVGAGLSWAWLELEVQ
jgi:3-oxoacyl-[acyl-carrier-protein] synthase-3